MRNISFAKAILCMALFFGYSSILGMDESYKAAKAAEAEKKSAEREAVDSAQSAKDRMQAAKKALESQLQFRTQDSQPQQPKKPATAPQQPKTEEVTRPEEKSEEKTLSFKERQAKLQESLRFKPAVTASPLDAAPLQPKDVEVTEQQRLDRAVQQFGTKKPTTATAPVETKVETPKEPTTEEAEKNIDRTQADLNQTKKELEEIGRLLEAALKSKNKEEADRLGAQASEKQLKIQATESTIRQYEELLGRKAEGPAAKERYAKMAADTEALRSKHGQTISDAPIGTPFRQADEAAKKKAEEEAKKKEAIRLGSIEIATETKEVKAAVTDLALPLKEPTRAKQAQSFLQKNKKLLIAGGGIGVGLLALAGILGAILGTQSDDKDSTAAAPITPDITPITPPVIPDIKPDEGIVPPSPYPDAKDEDKDNKDNKEVVDSVVSFYTDIEERFKKALKSSSYFDKIFKIEGEATSGESTKTKISIEYDFTKKGAGELGTPFTPFVVKMLPQGINGIAINPDDIKTLMQDGPAKELFTTLLQPNSSFVFMIKIILLINTTLSDTSKKDVEKINFIIDEAIKLCSRLVLTQKQTLTPDSLVAKMPQIFQKIINDMSLKMYGDLVDNVDDPENTVLIKRIGELQKKRDYNQIKAFMKKQIVPLVKGDLTHTEKQHLLYTLQEQLAECPKTERQLWEHLDYLNSILTQINKSLAKTDKETVSKIKDIMKKIQDVKAGKKTVTVLTKKPELDISTEVYGKKVSLKTVLKILFKNFSKIYYAKFEGDKGFTPDNFILGKQATKYNLQAIFFRCLDESLQANQTLLNAKGNVTIRTSTTKKQTINPGKEFDKICNESSLKFVQTQAALKDSMLKLKANPTDTKLQEAYNTALTEIKNAANELLDDQIKFRRTFAVYLPMKQDDKSTQTPAELIQKRLNSLRKNSKYVDSIITSEYAPFKNALGFTATFLKKSTKSKASVKSKKVTKSKASVKSKKVK
ncbi:MAG: hypothetical protein V1646_01870 [bacterium]